VANKERHVGIQAKCRLAQGMNYEPTAYSQNRTAHRKPYAIIEYLFKITTAREKLVFLFHVFIVNHGVFTRI